MVARLRAFFRTRTGRLILHDGAIAAGVGYAAWDAAGHSVTWGAASAAGLVAVKAFLRLILPVPAATDATSKRRTTTVRAERAPEQNSRSETSYEIADRIALLPPPSGRKGGALPSPVDARDWQAKLPRLSSIPATCDYGAGITFGMLLNDRIGDCYPAALLHALQVLTEGKFDPTDADALHVYEQVGGYRPGDPSTDNGTVGRKLFAWAKAQGLIKSYAAVPATRTAVRQAIAAHKAVLCEWALPVGAEREGDVWTMPRTGRAAGSWGYHATVETGFTTTRKRNVTWGEYGTVTDAFEDAYLQAAWVIEAPDVIPAIG